jgi:hypothetical protein
MRGWVGHPLLFVCLALVHPPQTRAFGATSRQPHILIVEVKDGIVHGW